MTTEILKALDSVEAKFNSYQVEQRVLADRMLQLEQKGAMRMDGHIATPANLGAQIATKFDALRESYEQNKSVSFKLPIEIKTFVSTANVASHQQVPGLSYAMAPDSTLLLAALPSRPMPGVSSAHYSRFMGSSGAVAVQAGEGATKATAFPDFDPIAQNAITIAGLAPISEQALRTRGELESVVNSFLTDKIRQGIDTVLIGGTAEVSWPFAGLKTLAQPYASLTYTDLADAIAECVAHMRWGGLAPNVVVLNPMGYLGLILARDLEGRYMTGSYLADVPLTVHGCRVVFNSGIDVDEALILDTRHIELGYSSELEITIGHNFDDFARNKQTIRAEASIIPIDRHIGAARLVTPAAA